MEIKVPSGAGTTQYLKIAISTDHQTLLNTTVKNVLMGHIFYGVKGKGAKQKIAKPRLDFVEGNTNYYAKCLNVPKWLKENR